MPEIEAQLARQRDGMAPTIQRNDTARGRTYTIVKDEVVHVLPSVTSILSIINKPALVPWAKKVSLEKVRQKLYAYVDDPLFGGQRAIERNQVDSIIAAASKRPDEVRDAAANVGSRAHEFIDQWLKGERGDPPSDLRAVVDNFLRWHDESGLDITSSEKVVYSFIHGYAGTMDATATHDGGPVVLDWKTGNALYPEARLQVAAYALALWEMNGRLVDEAWIVRFARDAPKRSEDAFEAYRMDRAEIQKATAAWLAALQLYQWLKAQG